MRIVSLMIVEVAMVSAIAIALLRNHAITALDVFRQKTRSDPLLEWTRRDWLLTSLTALVGVVLWRYVFFPIAGSRSGVFSQTVFWLAAVLATWALLRLLQFLKNPTVYMLRYPSESAYSAGKRLVDSGHPRTFEILVSALRIKRSYHRIPIADLLLQLDDVRVLEPLLDAYRREPALWPVMVRAFKRFPDIRGVPILLSHEGNGEAVVAALTPIIRDHGASVEQAHLEKILGMIAGERFFIYRHTEDTWVNPTPDWDVRVPGTTEEMPVDTDELKRVTLHALSSKQAPV